MFKFLFLLFSWALLLENVSAQVTDPQVPTIIPPSPEAASLAKYVEIPVSTFNGVPNINIPLYEITEGDIKIPVSLSYHSSGIAVNEEATNVGLGWTLNAGGEIVYEQRGKYDKNGSQIGNRLITQPLPLGIIQGNHFLSNQHADYMSEDGTYENYYCGFSNTTPSLGKSGLDVTRIDGEPDLYIFNFGSYSGKFVFQRTYNSSTGAITFTPQVIDRQKIIFTEIPAGTVLTTLHGQVAYQQDGLMAQTPDGFKYYFLVQEQSAVYDSRDGGNSDVARPTSYKLVQIISPKGRQVDFGYQEQDGVLHSPNFSISINKRQYMNDVPDLGTVSITQTSCQYLQYIYFTNGYVQFFNSPRTDIKNGLKLDSIYVFQTGNIIPVKKIILNYNIPQANLYFSSANAGSYPDGYPQNSVPQINTYMANCTQIRLKLSNVKVGPELYEFLYNNTPLPPKASSSVDYWGFYNGASNSTMLPNGFDLQYYYDVPADMAFYAGANRKPDSVFIQAGILKTIRHPTKGTTTFYYQANRFTNLANIKQQQSVLATDYNNSATDILNSAPFTITTAAQYVPVTITMQGSIPTGLGQFYVAVQQYTNNVWSNVSGEVWDMYDLYSRGNTSPEAQSGEFRPTSWGYGLDEVANMTLVSGGQYRVVAVYPNGIAYDTHKHADIALSYYSISPATKEVLGGGLRIAQIVDDPVTGSKVTRNYTYTNGSNLNMPLFTRTMMYDPYNYPTNGQCYPYPSQGYTNPTVCDLNLPNGSPHITYISNTGSALFSSMLMGATNSADGSFVGYKNVSVEYNGADRGRTDYTYNVTSTSFYPYPTILPGTPQANVLTNGLLLQEVDNKYNTATQTFIPIKRITTSYDSVFDKNQVWGFKQEFNDIYFARLDNSTNTKQCFYLGEVGLHFYPIFMGRVQPTKQEVDIMDGPNTVTTLTSYFYTPDGFLRSSSYVNSKGQQIASQRTYPNDYTGVSTGPIPALRAMNMIAVPIETVKLVNGNAVSGIYTDYMTTASTALPIDVNSIESPSPVTGFSLSTPNNVKNSNYQLKYSLSYGTNNNISEIDRPHDLPLSYIWGYNANLPVAEVKNANSGEVAYTSFETAETGNWTYNSAGITTQYSHTGSSSYQLNGNITGGVLVSNKNYIISYWTKNGYSFTVSGTVSGYPQKGATTTDGWTFYQHRITGVTSASISGSGFIDELRLHPADAQMNTYTYAPLTGATSAEGPNGDLAFYEYDAFQRLINIKDWQGNIIKNIQYNYNNTTPVTQPLIHALNATNGIVQVGYTPSPGAAGNSLQYLDLSSPSNTPVTVSLSGSYTGSFTVPFEARSYRIWITSAVNSVNVQSDPKDIYVSANTAIINSLSVSGLNITVNYTPLSGATYCPVQYTNMATSATGNVVENCGSPVTITVPVHGATYQIVVTTLLSSGPVASPPMSIYVP